MFGVHAAGIIVRLSMATPPMSHPSTAKQPPPTAKPEPTVAASIARGKRISHIIASCPSDQVGSTKFGMNLFINTPRTVLSDTGTAPTEIAIESETNKTPKPNRDKIAKI